MMVSPFSNTKVRLPQGFQSLLVGLSTEILRSQPRNIHEFAADYFERLLQRREQGDSNSAGKSTVHEDRSRSNQTFQEEFPVNDPGIQNAATKIQAQFRGYKVRRDLEKMKEETDEITDSNQQESNYDHYEYQKSSNSPSARSQSQDEKSNDNGKSDQLQAEEEELTEEQKREQERAAVSIQAQFRGYQVRKNLRETSDDANEQDEQESTNNAGKTSNQLDDHEKTKTGENSQDDRRHLEREPTQLSDDFGKYRRTSSDSDLVQDDATGNDEMSDSNLDKAATRIQASYRGYKIRKELGSGTGAPLTGHEQDHSSSSSSQAHDEYDNARNKNILSPSAEGNKEPVVEEDDNAAAVKIQAAYRGYRVRKDLEK